MGVHGSSDYAKAVLEEKIEQLTERYGTYFKCNSKSEEVIVPGRSVSRINEGGYFGGWQEVIIEPNCINYNGGYHTPGQGLMVYGGECGLGGSCPYCRREGFSVPNY